MLNRRQALLGILAAPVIIRTPGLLMPLPRRSLRQYWQHPGDHASYWSVQEALGSLPTTLKANYTIQAWRDGYCVVSFNHPLSRHDAVSSGLRALNVNENGIAQWCASN